MAKANQKIINEMSHEERMKVFNKQFDATIKVLEDMARASKTIMPLVTSSLKHTVDLVYMYQESFNKGIEHEHAKKNK